MIIRIIDEVKKKKQDTRMIDKEAFKEWNGSNQ